MADFTDVANALVATISAAVYPNGIGAASIAPQAQPILVYQGWPIAEQLDVDLKTKLHISVFPTPTERVIEQRMQEWQPLSVPAASITLTLGTNTVTVSGTVATGQNAALIVDGKAYVYAVQANDTLITIATALASLVNADRTASNTGAVITIPNPKNLIARVGVQGTSIRELRRQEKVFQISVWASSFALRDPVAAKVDTALAAVSRISLTDGTQGILRYRSSIQNDSLQKSGIYRRDMLYAVEYATTETSLDTTVVTEQTAVAAQFSGSTVGQVIINA